MKIGKKTKNQTASGSCRENSRLGSVSVPNGTGGTGGFGRLRFTARLSSRRIAGSSDGGSLERRPWLVTTLDREHQRVFGDQFEVNIAGGISPLVGTVNGRAGVELQAIPFYCLARPQSAGPLSPSVWIRSHRVEHGVVFRHRNS